jgi:hypothetical protein
VVLKALRSVYAHPVARGSGRVVRGVVIASAVILAVALATSASVDVGPALKAQAEAQGGRLLQRPMHIGRLRVHLWSGQFIFEDLVIGGPSPEARPFFTAKRIAVAMPWSTLFGRRIVFSSVDIADWEMFVETMADGSHTFPKLPSRASSRDSTAWTTTLQYVRAHRGETTYRDYGTPWSVVTRNIDLTIARTSDEYRGRLQFDDGTVVIQSYEPFGAAMRGSFTINDGRVVFDRIDLTTDGAETRLVGDVSLSHWPEQMYKVQSTIDFPTMRTIFFAHDTFSLSGTAQFDGTFHLFKEQMEDGRTRTGREVKGTFSSPRAGVNDLRFSDLRGAVRWVPELVDVTETTAGFYGGQTRLAYVMAPLGNPSVQATYTFDAAYENVDLDALSAFLEIDGLRLAGRASGENRLAWPRGRFADRTGRGTLRLAPPAGVGLLTRRISDEQRAQVVARHEAWGPFSNHRPLDSVPVGGEVVYAIDPEGITIASSRVATEDTFVEFEGRTAYGEASRIPFHVTSADWQESDRLLAGILTAFGSRTSAISVGGEGTFDGVMLNSVSRPRIEGTFTGERMRAWDIEWGSARGSVVIENSYVDVKDVVITRGDSTIETEGRFSAGYPRRDGGEEINARVRLVRRPVGDLRRAFDIDDYDVDGWLSGEFRVYGGYQTPLGFGTMSIDAGVAYGEPFETATSAVRLEGAGVRLDNIRMAKGGGSGSGSAYVGWNGTYSFNFDARAIPVENLALATQATIPLSGLLDFTAGGSGTFEAPRYDVHGTIRDFFAGDEGIGQVAGDIRIEGELLSLTVEAASPRLAISGAGRIALTPEMDTEMSFSVSDTSLDPYLRALDPRVSPFTTAVASGRIRVVGELANIDRLLVDVTVDRLDLRFFDYRIRNASPLRLALDRHAVRFTDVRLVGEDTQLDLSGTVNLHDERIAVRVRGDANLGILQGFVSDMRSTGRASLEASFEGPLQEPAVTGTMTVENGRFRHFALPHALENVTGPVRFDSRSVRLDEVTARLGGGPVQFGGSIGIVGYLPGRLDVTMRGESMRLRFPAGMTSVVDADLALAGVVEGATLSGKVLVRNAVYARAFDPGSGLLDFTGDVTTASGPPVSTLPLRYDVQISAPSTLEVRNNAARLVASADLTLRGTYDRPLILGRAEIDRGTVTFEGRRYILTRGSIDLNNPTRLDPFFDLEAETRVRVPGETYRVTLRASGTFDRLLPEISADPPLPQAEVLALLLGDAAPGRDVEFRQYSTDITPQQQLLRERATRELTGAISSQVGRVVEQAFGVDTFQLTPSLVDPNQQSSRLDPAARLVIGKRLSDRLFLTYSRSLSSSASDQIILLEYDQTDRFSWVLSRNEDRTYALDVRVRRTF